MAELVGTNGAETLIGGPQPDHIRGQAGADHLVGAGGRDYLSSQGDGALLDGGDDNDEFSVGPSSSTATVTILGGDGNDLIQGTGGMLTVDAGAGHDEVFLSYLSGGLVTLGTGRDIIFIRSSAIGASVVVTDFTPGIQGDQFTLWWPEGGWDGAANLFAGHYRLVQQGRDVLVQYDADGPLSSGSSWIELAVLRGVDAASLTAENFGGWAPDGSPALRSDFVGSAAADRHSAGQGSDLLSGLDGADSLLGRVGHDTIHGGAGGDDLDGGFGDDQLFGDDGNDRLAGGGGRNFLRGGEGDDRLIGGMDFDDLHGNHGDDFVEGHGGDDWVVGGQGNDLLHGHSDGDVVYGNLGDDTCYGDDGNDWVRGGQGDDSVSAGAGNDYVSGDRGSDTISGGAGADLFHSFVGAGLDRITDFNAAEGDRVNLLAGTSYTLRQEGADTVVDMSNGDQVVLVGVTLSSLPAGWIFVS